MKLDSFFKTEEGYYIVVDEEAAKYIGEQLYRWGSSNMNLLAARNKGKFIIEPEDIPEIQKINQTMELMVTANKLIERIKKERASEDAQRN